MMWKSRLAAHLCPPPLRHRIASWLLGVDTTRAIYVGKGEARLTWADRLPFGSVIMGASVGLEFDPATGVYSTPFAKKEAV